MATVSVVASLIGKGVLAQAVYDTSNYLLGFARESVIDNHPVVSNVLEDLDIHASLDIVNAILKETPDNYEKHVSLHICIHHINDIIGKIQNLLKSINDEINNHQNKYFHYWRTPTYHNDINKLKKNKKILDERVDMFIKVLQIPKTPFSPSFKRLDNLNSKIQTGLC
jgi:hypothetical protein